MEIDSFFGVPAHPLLVHLPVVLVPTACLGIVLALAVGRWRHWLLPVAFAFGLAATFGTYMAQESGEPLEHRVERARGETEALEEHTELGETLLPFVAIFTGLLGAATAVDVLDRRRGDGEAPAGFRAALPTALVALAVVGGGLATWKVVEVGHSGAEAAWHDVTASGN